MTAKIGRILIVVVLAGALGAGCNGLETQSPGESGAGAFWASAVRLQRSFTRILPEAGERGEGASIEAFVTLLDQFGDPIKAVGQFRFEIYRYQPAAADPRGRRFEGEGMQLVDLSDTQINQQYWDAITHCYRMKLKLPPEAATPRQIVLQVTFLASPENRVQDMLVLERQGAAF